MRFVMLWSWTTLLYNKKSRIRTRALGALTGVSSGPLTTILRTIKIQLNPYHRAAQQTQIHQVTLSQPQTLRNNVIIIQIKKNKLPKDKFIIKDNEVTKGM